MLKASVRERKEETNVLLHHAQQHANLFPKKQTTTGGDKHGNECKLLGR
jgi:hypothetical protein